MVAFLAWALVLHCVVAERMSANRYGELALDTSEAGAESTEEAGEVASATSASSTARALEAQRLLMWMLGHEDGSQSEEDRHNGTARKEAGANGKAGVADPKAQCKSSGYFVDWGSSGMKVYRTHRFTSSASLPEDAAVEGSMDPFKLQGLDVNTPVPRVKAILDGFLGDLLEGSGKAAADAPRGAVLATAGFRLQPKLADGLWSAVRSWADEHPGPLGRCGQGTDNHDCRTLPGSAEAYYEAKSAASSLLGSELMGAEHFGFVSAGGASLQAGIVGTREEQVSCLRDLGKLDTSLDTERADIQEIKPGTSILLISFLSSNSASHRECADKQGCDYEVGGIAEMRKRFDAFLVAQGRKTNPCLPKHAQLSSGACADTGSLACLMDRFGQFITSLPPDHDSVSGLKQRAACASSVKAFMGGDLMLNRWRASKSCMGLAGQVERWALLTSFSKSALIGSSTNLKKFLDFGDLHMASKMSGSVRLHAQEGDPAVVLNSMLLVQFLTALGIESGAEVQGIEAAWSDAAMLERGLVQGWPTSGKCAS